MISQRRSKMNRLVLALVTSALVLVFASTSALCRRTQTTTTTSSPTKTTARATTTTTIPRTSALPTARRPPKATTKSTKTKATTSVAESSAMPSSVAERMEDGGPAMPKVEWSKEFPVNDTVRVHIAKMHSKIEQRLEGCDVRAINPVSFKTASSLYLVRAEVELEDDWDDDGENLHVKYEDKSGEPALLAINNRVDEDSRLKDFARDMIEPCDDE